MYRVNAGQDLHTLAGIVDLLPDPTVVRDGQGSILGCNDPFARLIGERDPEGLRGLTLKKVASPALAARFRRADATDAPVVRFSWSGEDISRVYRFRQVRHGSNDRIGGWVTTVREEAGSRREIENALTIARTLANRNYSELTKHFSHVMEQTAATLGAKGALVIRKDTDSGQLRIMCRWERGDGVRHETDHGSSHIAPHPWWSRLSKLEPLHDVVLNVAGDERCDIYPVHAQRELLGALILIAPRRSSWFFGDLVATIFAGLMVRREIQKLLNAYSADLEKRVLERTSDLNVAFETLKQTQVRLVQVGKMASIGQLAAGIAHEINNPIGFIKSNLGMLARYVERLVGLMKSPEREEASLMEVEQEIQEMISESNEGIRRVQDIVSNLRDFARIEEGETRLADINELIRTSLKVLDSELKYKATVHQEMDKLPEIRCMPDRLNQVFLNLLINAMDAIEKRGDIWITTGIDEDQVMIRIADNGHGIPPEVQERIFDPFFTTRDVGKGTGLGLSIVWDIIQAHNGTIVLSSTPGEGSEFIISLPARTERLTAEDVLRNQ